MNKHSVTLPDGTVATRNSKTNTYSHAVAGKRENGEWGVWGWQSREDLAVKFMTRHATHLPRITFRICEVESK